jgi:hypothetical protein
VRINKPEFCRNHRVIGCAVALSENAPAIHANSHLCRSPAARYPQFGGFIQAHALASTVSFLRHRHYRCKLLLFDTGTSTSSDEEATDSSGYWDGSRFAAIETLSDSAPRFRK